MGAKPFRQLDAKAWDIQARLTAMDAEGVTTQVLSPMPELLSYWMSAVDALTLAHHVNGFIAAMVAIGRERFQGLGMVPLQDPALAAAELARLKRDGLRGVELGSNISGVLLGDARFEEFFAEAERLEMAIFVHALHPVGAERLVDMPDLVPFAAFPLDTALTAVSLIRAGVPARYPRLKLGFSHGGGAIVPLVHRLHQGWLLSEGFAGKVPEAPAHYASRFFYDSLVYDAGWLRYLKESFAPNQFFAGTDHPFPIEQRGLRKFLCQSTDDPVDPIYRRTAERFLGFAH